jgi:BlaI family penicillinase repressor
MGAISGRITESEWKVMNLLWEKPRTLMQLTKSLYEETKWTKFTVLTLLRRLLEKEAVSYTQQGRTKTFQASISRKEAEVEAANSMRNAFFAGRIPSMVSAMVEGKKPSEEEIEEICRILNIERVKHD